MTLLAAALLTLATVAAAQTPAQVREPAVVPITDADDGAYRLSAGDLIELKFMLNPELNETVRIRPDGRISMPMVGEMLVGRSTIAELSTRLAAAYQDILRTPTVIIQVKEFADRRVFVGGEVNSPGMQPLIGTQTALGAVMEAGGFKESAARGELVVIRKGDEDKPRLIRLSMKMPSDTEGPEAASFRLQPLDVVLVAESGIARTGRAIDQYVRKLLPFTLTGGFTYLFNAALVGGQ